MPPPRPWSPSLLVALLLAACDEDPRDASGDPPPPNVEESCASVCEHVDDCNGGDDGVAGCREDCEAAAAFFRDDVFDAYVECASMVSCGTEGKVCADWDVDPLPFHDAYLDACRDKVDVCLDVVGGADTWAAVCGPPELIAVLSGSVIADLDACLDADCDDVGPCVTDVLDRYRTDPE